jgi:hypothetical protein
MVGCPLTKRGAHRDASSASGVPERPRSPQALAGAALTKASGSKRSVNFVLDLMSRNTRLTTKFEGLMSASFRSPDIEVSRWTVAGMGWEFPFRFYRFVCVAKRV